MQNPYGDIHTQQSIAQTAGASGAEEMPFPILAALLISAAAQGISAYAGSRSASKSGKAAADADKERTRAQIGYDESLADPFRGQMSQGKDLAKLDMLARMQEGPTSMEFGKVQSKDNPYAKYIPTMTGGPSYERSPELIQWLQMLQRNIAGGNTMPTMTNPANFGRSSAMDLVGAQASGQDPATINWQNKRRGPGSQQIFRGLPPQTNREG